MSAAAGTVSLGPVRGIRRAKDTGFTVFLWTCAVLALVPLTWIAFYVMSKGIGALSWNFFTKVPAGPLYSPQQALEDAHIRAAGLLNDTDYPGLPRPAPLAPTPVDLSETPGRFRHRAPTLGEHTDAILAELGYAGSDIAGLRARGVI